MEFGDFIELLNIILHGPSSRMYSLSRKVVIRKI